ncbi:MAG: hypothetical protein FWC09_06880 [Lachnospiraceae bacterium]|nr:hypothetical protein [Lachnospiraceae bacterium]
MLMTFDKVSRLIESGKLLHIAGTEQLLRKLPKGSWIGGSTEYFMDEEGGKISDNLLYVTEFPYENFAVKVYTSDDIKNVAPDAFDNGFSVLIVPFDSEVHKEYAHNAANYEGMFIKVVVGWVAGMNLEKSDQTPISVNGVTGEAYADKAVVLHLKVPADKTVSVNIINIFEQDMSSPVFEFYEEGFSVRNCLVDGKETVLADYIAENNINTKLPLVGDYAGSGVNVSSMSVENGVVNFYAPLFSGIKYRMSISIPDYEQAFQEQLAEHTDTELVFSCNCILNFLYGGLEGKKIGIFSGPITFGEIAYQLVNQTLVYVTVK